MTDYRQINREVMTDTKYHYEHDVELQQMTEYSIAHQSMVAHEDNIDQPLNGDSETEYIVSGGRSFAEAGKYVREGYRVAVLNFANNHSIGGAPFAAGAQEESLCRCSTLLPCLEAMKDRFYKRHRDLYDSHKISYMGNDDLIYTPDVCVFKSDDLTEPIYPKMMPREKWYKVDVITCAAPELQHAAMPADYEKQISTRIKKILDVAKMKGAEVLILGAWGCGAFRNPEDVVARVFHDHLKNYDFKKVVFAMGRYDCENSAFYKEFSSCSFIHEANPVDVNSSDNVMPNSLRIISLLAATGRENIDKVIKWMYENNFFEAPASVTKHNNFRGGLAKHSLEVYEEAMKLNEKEGLPVNSVTIAALLHDICKADQFFVNADGSSESDKKKIAKGHGRRSMFILKRGCQLPLSYDEEMTVWWHMGEHEPSKDRFSEEYKESQNIPLCKLIQKADANAASKAMPNR